MGFKFNNGVLPGMGFNLPMDKPFTAIFFLLYVILSLSLLFFLFIIFFLFMIKIQKKNI